MEQKEQLLMTFLESEYEKTITDLKEVNTQLNKLSVIPNDEFALDGNAEVGATNKQSVIDGLKYQKAMYTGILSQTERFQNIVKMTEDELLALEKTMKLAREQMKDRRDNMKLDLDEAVMAQNSNYHIEWCELHGTDEPWATSEKCTCPGAYIIRKRMSEGLTFAEAKKYVIENEAL